MNPNDWSDIRRDLTLIDFQILYLQSEQQKRRMEMDDLQRRMDDLKRRMDSVHEDLEKQRKQLDLITSPAFIKRVEDPDLRKKLKAIARVWKRTKKP